MSEEIWVLVRVALRFSFTKGNRNSEYLSRYPSRNPETSSHINSRTRHKCISLGPEFSTWSMSPNTNDAEVGSVEEHSLIRFRVSNSRRSASCARIFRAIARSALKISRCYQMKRPCILSKSTCWVWSATKFDDDFVVVVDVSPDHRMKPATFWTLLVHIWPRVPRRRIWW